MNNPQDLFSSFDRLSRELAEADFGNQHLTKRYHKMVDALLQQPKLGFPQVLQTEAEVEGAYRFLRNPNVTLSKSIAPHYEATLERCRRLNEVVAIHDTTECGFSGEAKREGLGYINQTDGQGFFAHFALISSADGKRIPLGVAGLSINSRTRIRTKAAIRARRKNQRRADRESLRWAKLVDEVEQRFSGASSLIHVMDREGDIYPLYDEMSRKNRRYVIRLCHDRVLAKESGFGNVSEALKTLPVLSEEEIVVSKRGKKTGNKAPPAREGRIARIRLSATRVLLKRPCRAPLENSSSLWVNVVHAEEIGAAKRKDKVEWFLVTSEPVETAADARRVIEIYRGRWIIEEFFKVLKTGCNYEQRQLESLHTLLNALALFVPVAHRLLLLRTASRLKEENIGDLLTRRQVAILKALPHLKVPDGPTLDQALLAIARLGGHLKSNGDPGWLVLWRGYQTLLQYEVGWRAKK